MTVGVGLLKVYKNLYLYLIACQENVTLCSPPLFIKTGPRPKQRYNILVPNI